MSTLNRDDILNADDVPVEEVFIPEWNGKVRVKGLTVAERERYEKKISTWKNGELQMNRDGARALLVSMCIVDEGGKRMFYETDIDALSRKSGKAVERVWDAAARLSGMLGDDEEKVEEDFDDAQSEPSSSDSL